MSVQLEKVNQHYVPQFWQRRFSDGQGQLFVRYRSEFDPEQNPLIKGRARPVSSKRTMTDDYTYTIYDPHFLPNNSLEDALAVEEGRISKTEAQLLKPHAPISGALHSEFCHGIALALCRLPDTMRHGLEVAKTYLYDLGCVHEMDRSAFESMLKSHGGVALTDEEYEHIEGLTGDELLAKAMAIDDLSPQHPALSEQAVLLAVNEIEKKFSSMDLEIIEDASGPFFIVGDLPVRGSNLAQGFSVPLSKTAAARFKPTGSAVACSRRTASLSDVQAINQDQFDRCRTHVIGPDTAYLDSLKW